MADRRFHTGFTSARGRELGPQIVQQIHNYAVADHGFRTDDIANALGLERGTADRHFVTQFLRRLEKAGIVENQSTKTKYKEWVVADQSRLAELEGGTPVATPEVPEPTEDIHHERRALGASYITLRLNHIDQQLAALSELVAEIRSMLRGG